MAILAILTIKVGKKYLEMSKIAHLAQSVCLTHHYYVMQYSALIVPFQSLFRYPPKKFCVYTLISRLRISEKIGYLEASQLLFRNRLLLK